MCFMSGRVLEKNIMPIFEYQCEKCGHHMDVLVKSYDQKGSSVSCEKCGSKATKRVIASFSVGHDSSSAGSCPTCCPTGTCGL